MESVISEAIVKMIGILKGNRHDICHFLKVHAYAETIAVQEGLDGDERAALELAAVIHDIACPLCKEKYGNANGNYQEIEGVPLAQEFLCEFELPQDVKDRIVFLVGHHHTLSAVDGLDYQILLEADYLVNADEMGFSASNIANMRERLFKTPTGRLLLDSIYGVPELDR